MDAVSALRSQPPAGDLGAAYRPCCGCSICLWQPAAADTADGGTGTQLAAGSAGTVLQHSVLRPGRVFRGHPARAVHAALLYPRGPCRARQRSSQQPLAGGGRGAADQSPGGAGQWLLAVFRLGCGAVVAGAMAAGPAALAACALDPRLYVAGHAAPGRLVVWRQQPRGGPRQLRHGPVGGPGGGSPGTAGGSGDVPAAWHGAVPLADGGLATAAVAAPGPGGRRPCGRLVVPELAGRAGGGCTGGCRRGPAGAAAAMAGAGTGCVTGTADGTAARPGGGLPHGSGAGGAHACDGPGRGAGYLGGRPVR